MTVWAACANGNLTSSSTWESCDSTSYSNSESANTALTTSQVSSSTFTPGAITIDGIGVKIASRAASPSGTITVQLTQGGSLVTGTNVTINVSDLPTCSATSGTTSPVSTAEGGWVFFKFASPVTLVGATAYAVSAATSVASQVNLWSASSTNWSRYLRTTTTGAPAAGDDLIITGEWTAAATVTARTVTMDSTAATAYGSNTTSQVTPFCSISTNGTLQFGTTASTAYVLQCKGHIVIYNGGTFSMGMKSGTAVPSSSSATLQFQLTANGDFGIVARNGATLNAGGSPRTSGKAVVQTKLTANAAGGATSLTVADDTGWLSGDLFAIAATDQTYTHAENRTLNANAGASSLAFTSGLTNAHSGTSPTQAEVALLTRNVLITSTSSSLYTFVYCGNKATAVMDWCGFEYVGYNASNKYGVTVDTTSGTVTLTHCSFFNLGYCGVYTTQATLSTTVTVQNCTFYNVGLSTGGYPIYISAAITGGGTYLVDTNLIIGGNSGTSAGITLNDVTGTCTNNVFASCNNYGMVFQVNGQIIGTFSGNTCHSCASYGVAISNFFQGTLLTQTCYRNGLYGFYINCNSIAGAVLPANALTLKTAKCFGNASINYLVTGSALLILDNCTSNSDTTYTTATGLQVQASNQVFMYSCNFSTASGILTACTNDLLFNTVYGSVFADDCIFAGTNVYSYSATVNFQRTPIITAQNFGQTANDNRSYWANGGTTLSVIQTNTGTVYGTNTRSEQMSPASSTYKFQSSSIFVACPSGKAATPIVQVQKNGSYNGNAPRLILRRQDSMGVTADTVVATFSAAANTWQALTGTTGAAPQDGVYEYIVDCDGTAGSVFVGDATATVA